MASVTHSEIDSTENKVLILGESNTGKTSIVLRFVNNSFSNNTKPTIGCDFLQKEMNVQGKPVRLSLWDTAGQERFRAISHCYYKMVRIIVLVFDLTNRKSFERLAFWKEEIEKFTDGQVLMLLVGNKADLIAERIVKREEAEDFVAKNGLKAYFETSAKNDSDVNVEKVFEFVGSQIGEAKANLQGMSDRDIANALRNGGENVGNEDKESSSCAC